MRRRWLSPVVLCVLALLAGCATIPTSSPVVAESRRAQGGGDGGVAIDYDPPPPGASPDLIVDSFMHAMVTYQPGYRSARAYLSRGANATWNPDAGVTVYADGSEPVATAASVTMEVRVVGTLGPEGTFVTASDQVFEHDFGLLKEDGEWRISKPPNGLLISRWLFTTSYVKTDVFFLDRTQTTLVPDARYVARGNRSADTLVRMLLSGPSQWLAPITVSAVPDNAQLEQSIATGETPTISLSQIPPDLEARSLLCAQLAATLRQVPTVTGLRLTGTDGSGVIVPGQLPDGTVPLSLGDQMDPINQLSSQLFAVSDGHVVRVGDNGDLRPVAGDFGTQTWDASAIAISDDGLTGAVVAGEQIVGGTLDGQGTTVVASGTGLIRPQFWSADTLWFATGSGLQAATLTNGTATVKGIPAPALEGRVVTAFRLSPDKQRIAIVSVAAEVAEVGIARIDRQDDQLSIGGYRPVSLTRQDGAPAAGPIDVGWSSSTTLTVLLGAKKPMSVVDVDIDGVQLRDLGRVDSWGAVSLAVSPRLGLRAVADDNKGVWVYQDTLRWTRVPAAMGRPAYPG